MLVLVGHDERSFSLQINLTKDIPSIVQSIKDFSMTSSLCILLLLVPFWYLFNFSFNYECQPAIACSGSAMEVLEQRVGVFGVGSYIYVCACVCMFVFTHVSVYVYMYMYVCMNVCMYVCMYICICMCIYVSVCVYIYIYTYIHTYDR